jgi:hypothetical protein
MERRTFLKYALAAPFAIQGAKIVGALGYLIASDIAGTLRKDLNEMLKDMLEVDVIRVGDSVIRAAGVAHANGFYKIHQKPLDEIIEKSDIIVSETNPGYATGMGKEFYKNLAAKCAQENKTVLNFDPRTATTTGSTMGMGIEALQGAAGPIAIADIDTKETTRLSAMGRAIAYYLSASTMFFQGVFQDTITDNERAYYNTFDFSNVLVADKISDLCKDNKNVGLIYGSAHIAQIEHYIKNPGLRKLKKILYLPYRMMMGSPHVESHFDTQWIHEAK